MNYFFSGEVNLGKTRFLCKPVLIDYFGQLGAACNPQSQHGHIVGSQSQHGEQSWLFLHTANSIPPGGFKFNTDSLFSSVLVATNPWRKYKVIFDIQ